MSCSQFTYCHTAVNPPRNTNNLDDLELTRSHKQHKTDVMFDIIIIIIIIMNYEA
jgi:hypothetical protein